MLHLFIDDVDLTRFHGHLEAIYLGGGQAEVGVPSHPEGSGLSSLAMRLWPVVMKMRSMGAYMSLGPKDVAYLGLALHAGRFARGRDEAIGELNDHLERIPLILSITITPG